MHRTAALSALQEIFNFPRAELPLRWGAAGNGVSYVAAISTEALYLGGEFKQNPRVHEDSEPGKFREKLWERDVIELFVRDKDQLRYQEFNLSPAGEWWSGVFEERRHPATFSFADLSPRIHTLAQVGTWRAAIELPFEYFAVTIAAPHALLINICACVGEGERSYFSAAALKGQTPDFHQPEAMESAKFAD